MEIRVENWLGHEIRFAELQPNDWWGVARDIATALKYKHTSHMLRLVDGDEKDEIRLTDPIGRNQKHVAISEFGIYEAIFNSEHEEAKDFKKWVKQLLKSLRQATGLEGFEVFRTLDKEHQKEAMSNLRESLREAGKVSYMKANTIADKAVSNKYGYKKMLKKPEMTPEMLIDRQPILEDTVKLMSMVDTFKLDISISKTIYGKYAG